MMRRPTTLRGIARVSAAKLTGHARRPPTQTTSYRRAVAALTRSTRRPR